MTYQTFDEQLNKPIQIGHDVIKTFTPYAPLSCDQDILRIYLNTADKLSIRKLSYNNFHRSSNLDRHVTTTYCFSISTLFERNHFLKQVEKNISKLGPFLSNEEAGRYYVWPFRNTREEIIEIKDWCSNYIDAQCGSIETENYLYTKGFRCLICIKNSKDFMLFKLACG